ncbi:MAG: N-acetyl-alpha-D-glucosaminyl L-malate synthase BshA [Planctomycetota bacterium]
MAAHLRIGIICHPTYGGSGVVASELALTLAEAGHRVHLFSHATPPRLARATQPVEVHVAQGIPYPLFESPPHDLAITSRVLDVHRVEGLDVVHAHYAIPHAISALVAREAARSARDEPVPRVITTLHGTDITLVGNDPSYAPLTQYALTGSDAVTSVSLDLARRTAANFVETPVCGIEVIPNFVDLAEFHPMPRHPGPPTAVHVSNFRRVKRVPFLVEAFADALQEVEARLVLVGDGPDQDEARRVARARGVTDHVTFLGLRDALPELLAPADLFCLSSAEESFGLSALEAMACGTAVLGTRVGGVAEVVVDGVTGTLVGADDRAAYARALITHFTDLERTHAMGRAARERAASKFERRAVVGQYVDLYERVLQRAKSPGDC